MTIMKTFMIRVCGSRGKNGKADCTADDLKQCNRWFIDLFSSVGEKVVIIEDDFDKTLAKLLD